MAYQVNVDSLPLLLDVFPFRISSAQGNTGTAWDDFMEGAIHGFEELK
jgi:hypothetical protein